jgi:hypothetical protein
LLVILSVASILIHTLGAIGVGRPYHWDDVYMPSGWSDTSNLWRWSTSPVAFYAKVWWRGERRKWPPNAVAKDGCSGSIRVPLPVSRMSPGDSILLPVEIQNTSNEDWWNFAGASGSGEMHVTYRWLRPDGTTEVGEGGRTILWRDVDAHGAITMPIRVMAPPTAGTRTLRLTVVAEGIRWCDGPGGTLLDLPIQVE